MWHRTFQLLLSQSPLACRAGFKPLAHGIPAHFLIQTVRRLGPNQLAALHTQRTQFTQLVDQLRCQSSYIPEGIAPRDGQLASFPLHSICAPTRRALIAPRRAATCSDCRAPASWAAYSAAQIRPLRATSTQLAASCT